MSNTEAISVLCGVSKFLGKFLGDERWKQWSPHDAWSPHNGAHTLDYYNVKIDIELAQRLSCN